MRGGKNLCERQTADQTWIVKISGIMSHLYLSDIQTKILIQTYKKILSICNWLIPNKQHHHIRTNRRQRHLYQDRTSLRTCYEY